MRSCQRRAGGAPSLQVAVARRDALANLRPVIQAAELETHRRALTGHCYRMLASSVDADDAVQETMVRAWKSLEKFDARASVRTWLHRIATNVCLDALSDRTRRCRPVEECPVGTVDDELETRPGSHWIEPIADARAIPSDEDPSKQLELRQSIRLAFVAALQVLPPKQRAALLLAEVVGWSPGEIAQCLNTTTAAINSALQRARATLAKHDDAAPARLESPSQEDLVDRYVVAFERFDITALAALLHEDATLSMPPYTLWLQGHHAIVKWLTGPGSACRGSRLIRTRASGTVALAQYRKSPQGGHRAWGLIVLEPEGDRFASMTTFLDAQTLFPQFGLALHLP